MPIAAAADYTRSHARARIILDVAERQAGHLCSRPATLAAGAAAGSTTTRRSLDEVANLVERPTRSWAASTERFLSLPREALVAVMKKHQRYFPRLR